MRKQAFTGGLRRFGFNATWPFARLTPTDDHMTLRLLGFVHTRWGWPEVENVQRVIGGMMGSPGVRIVLVDGQRIVFWTFAPRAVLAAFEADGVTVINTEGRPPKVWLGT